MHTPRRRHSHRLICVRAYTVRLSTMCATPSLVSSVHSSFLLPQHPQGFLLRVLHMCIQMASADHHKSSSWLYRGLAPHDADASDASSQDMYVSSTSYALNAPSKQVVAQLSTSSHGQQLLSMVRTLASQLLAQSILCPSAAAARGLVDNLQELHSCIVALDDMIDEQRISSGVASQLDQCRQWLRHIQGFVLQVLKQVGGFADDGQQPGVSSLDTTTSSMEEGGCSTSTAPNSAASLNAWRTMCQEASDALGNVAESMANGGAEEGAGQTGGKRTRLVAQSSRLSYASHWSKKVAI